MRANPARKFRFPAAPRLSRCLSTSCTPQTTTIDHDFMTKIIPKNSAVYAKAQSGLTRQSFVLNFRDRFFFSPASQHCIGVHGTGRTIKAGFYALFVMTADPPSILELARSLAGYITHRKIAHDGQALQPDCPLMSLRRHHSGSRSQKERFLKKERRSKEMGFLQMLI
jgi:hypothetical protein